jgi:drug/metabolite transporter (DMT)-like permease
VTRRAWLLFIALSVIWGIPYLLIKVAVRELTPASLVFLRTTIGALLLLPGVIRRGDLRALLPRWRPILLFTAVEVALPWWLLSDAQRRIRSSPSGLLVASVPLVGALLSRLSDAHEPLGTRRLAGLAAGFAGVVALLGLDLSGDLAAVGEMALVVLGLCALAYAPLGIAQLPPTLPSPAVISAVAVLGMACTAVAFLHRGRLLARRRPERT